MGTLGTADAGGTALTLPIAVDPATGAMFVQDLASSGGTQPVSGTVVVSNVITGTLASTNITSGTQQTLGTVGVVNSGTISALAAGTITTGTVSVTTGTVVGVAASGVASSGNPVLTAGTDSGGTVHSFLTSTTGIQAIQLNSGTITTGTILSAAINPKPTINILASSSSGTAAIGTLVASGGVGTSIYVCSYTIDGDSTTLGTAECILSFGTQITGTAVLFRATLNTLNEVAIHDYHYPVNAGVSNSPLTFLIQAGAGSVSWNVTYFVQ